VRSEYLQNWQGKIALITGASSGIGEATARLLGSHGLRTVLVARRADRLEKIADEIREQGGQADVIPVDLTQEDHRIRLYERITHEIGPVEILVNNAGFGWYGFYADMPWETAQEMLQVNVTATIHLTRLFLADMRKRNSGHIINVGSISGSIPSQGIALYGASKSFLDAFTTAVYRELSGTQVHIGVVRAGPVTSEFFQQARKRLYGRAIPAERFAISSERVAHCIWNLLKHPKRVVYIPSLLRVTPWIELLFGWIVDRLGPLHLRRQSIV
jgi:short-subunit dehydrogenase